MLYKLGTNCEAYSLYGHVNVYTFQKIKKLLNKVITQGTELWFT